MRFAPWLALLCGLILSSCGTSHSAEVLVVDGARAPVLVRGASTVQAALARAAVHLNPVDKVLFNGGVVPVNAALGPLGMGTLQVEHAMEVTLNGQTLQVPGGTVGEGLAQTGRKLYVADILNPPAEAKVAPGMRISYTPSAPLTVSADGREIQIRSAASSVDMALAEAGLPLVGLDDTEPAASEALPQARPVSLRRVTESVTLQYESIPFTTEYQDSPEVALGQQRVVRAGTPGLEVIRTTTLSQDGSEVSRRTDPKTVLLPAQSRLIARGTKIVEGMASVDGADINYWLKTQMYATVYSPCNSGTSGCSYGTASGRRAGKGVVAVDPILYASLNGQRLYIPGYGFAVIGDLGGGSIFERSTGISRYKWIDLGFDDGNVQDISGWVTVYFLAPAPAAIPDVLK